MNFNRLLVALTLVLTVFCVPALAQDKVVTGKVTDSKDGSPLAGATITAKGTTVITQTDANGVFKIKVPASVTTLVVTNIGYANQDVPIAAELSIKLIATSASLNEVVVIGYGTAKKKDVTGSVATVTSKDFVKGAITSPDQLITGKVAGVAITSNGGAPGAGSTIRIRGGASLNASNDPLIVIDGMPLSNSNIPGAANPLSLINPNDIESFTVLKDASAAAIYGSRASNGVIIITTKKGKSGKPVFSFSSQISASTIEKKVDVLNADQITQIVKANGNSSIVPLLGTAQTDWQNQIYQTALMQNNNLSIAGSLKHLPYRISLGYLNQDGVLKTDNLQRTSLGINLSPVLLDNHLKIDISLKGTYSKTRFANQGAIGSAVTFDPTQQVYSNSNRFGGFWEWLDPNNTTTGLKSLAPFNPLGLLMQKVDRSTVQRSIGNALIDYKTHFLPDLHAIVNVGYDVSDGSGTTVINDSAAMSYKRYKDANGVFHGGQNTQYKSVITNTYLNFYLNYSKDLKSIDSRIEAMAGYEYQDYKTKNYFYPDVAYDGTIVNPVNYPYDIPENTLVSFLGRVNYTFKNRYILTGTIRRDGSSKFNPNNRWGTFPSAAFAWRIKNESFLRSSSAVSDLKLRVGYGVTGQQDGIGNYDYISYYNLSNPTAQYQFGNNFYQMYRPGGYYYNRKWEQTATSNIAIDYGFLNNRITGTIEYYYKNTTDLLNQINQPALANFSNKIVANVGSMENRGVEFTINFQPVRTKDLVWDVAFNATYNENKITKLTISDDPNYPGAQFGGISGGTGNTILINSVGYNRGAFYVYKQVYDPKTGKPIDNLFDDKNRDGIINQNDLYQYKGVDPKSYYGLSTNVTYKKWNAGFVMRASIGNYVYNNVASGTGTLRNIINPIGYINNGSTDYLYTGFSGNGSNYYLSDYYVQNASFLRMDNINIGYNVGKVFNNKANLRLSANAQNVFVITKYKGLDPEINGGIDNNFYPRPRTFVFGLNLDF
ncbi:MAG: TonB-dependent receptor [Bacteroidota bacterium]|nr:TonB-dependent receptor [Bacteroidota bacterium]